FSNLRKNKRIVEDIDGILASKLVSADNPLAAIEMRQLISQVRYMPAIFRKAFFMVIIEGLAYEDAAKELGISIGTLKSRVNRAREFLEKGKAQDITEEEFQTPTIVDVDEPDNTKWYDTIRI